MSTRLLKTCGILALGLGLAVSSLAIAASWSQGDVLAEFGASLNGVKINFNHVALDKRKVTRLNILKKAGIQADVRAVMGVSSPCGMRAYQAMAVTSSANDTVMVTYSCEGNCEAIVQTATSKRPAPTLKNDAYPVVSLPAAFCQKLWNGAIPIIDEGL